MVHELVRALGAWMGNMRNGPAADGGGARMLGPLQRAPTQPALGWDDSQASAGRVSDSESPADHVGAPPPLAIAAGRTSSEGAACPGSDGALAFTGAHMPPPPAYIPTHGVAPAESMREVNSNAQPGAAARDATAEVETMLARQRSIVMEKRRVRGKTPVDQARVVATAQGRDPKDFVATIDADEGHSTPSPKRARSSPEHTGEKDHPPPPFPGTGKHATIEYKGFTICNSQSKNKWRVVPFCRRTYDKGFVYNTDPEAVWANVIEYCDNPTIPQTHWDTMSTTDQAKFTVASAERPAPPPAAIASTVGHRTGGRTAKRAKSKR